MKIDLLRSFFLNLVTSFEQITLFIEVFRNFVSLLFEKLYKILATQNNGSNESNSEGYRCNNVKNQRQPSDNKACKIFELDLRSKKKINLQTSSSQRQATKEVINPKTHFCDVDISSK